jgi:hypothetical protein
MEILESIAWLALGFIPTLVTLEVIASTTGRKRVKLFELKGKAAKIDVPR